MADDCRAALMSLLRDCLDDEEYAAAVGLLDRVVSNPAAPTTDRKLTSDSFSWVQREGRRLEQKIHVENERKRQASVPAVMALDEKGTTPMIDRETLREWQEIRRLEQETGILGMDSASKIYRAAIEQKTGQSAADLPAAAAKSVYDALKNKPRAKARMATDAAATSARNERFPNGGRLLNPFS